MTWANVDDLFPEHPKVLAAGGDAAWLYICGLCFTNRNLTEGRIPKAVVPRLSDRKAPGRLAQRLVEVGLWHEENDAYLIHDWEKYNEGAEKVKARKEQARNAARVKWSKHAKGNAQSSAASSAHAHAPPPDEQCDEHAGSMPGVDAGAMPSHSSPTTEHRSSSSHHGVGGPPAEEEEDHGQGREAWDGVLVARLVAKRRLSKLTNPPPEGIRRTRWLTTTVENLLAEDSHAIAEQLEHGVSVPTIVDLLEPPAAPPAAPPSPYPVAGQQPAPTYDEVLVDGEWQTVRVSA